MSRMPLCVCSPYLLLCIVPGPVGEFKKNGQIHMQSHEFMYNK